MPEAFISKKSVEIALAHLMKFGDTDIFPPTSELRARPWTSLELMPGLKAIDDLALAPKVTAQTNQVREPVYISAFQPRVAVQLPFLISVFSTMHAFSLIKFLEDSRNEILSSAIFSYRSNQSRPQELFDGDIGWQKFVDRQALLASERPWVVSIDIAQFYSSIKLTHLDQLVTRFALDETDASRIKYFFYYSQGPSYGLPVGGDYSRVIGEMILSEIDEKLVHFGWAFCRFVDDIRIYFATEAEARSSSYRLVQLMSLLGFQVNSSKFRIDRVSKIHSTKAVRFDRKKMGNLEQIDSNFFDPYSELVITRVEELKRVALANDLEQLIDCELEKISPDPRAVKMYISALNFSEAIEIERCISKLIQKVMDPHYFFMLPKLVRLFAKIKAQLSRNFLRGVTITLVSQIRNHHHQVPSSVLGQIYRMIYDGDVIVDWSLAQLLSEHFITYSHSLFVRRELVQLLRTEPRIVDEGIIKIIHDNPALLSVWDPSTVIS